MALNQSAHSLSLFGTLPEAELGEESEMSQEQVDGGNWVGLNSDYIAIFLQVLYMFPITTLSVLFRALFMRSWVE